MFIVHPRNERPFQVRGINAAMHAATDATILVGGYIYDVRDGRISDVRLAIDYAAEIRAIRHQLSK